MTTNRLHFSERIDTVKMQTPTEYGVDNIITRKLKECAQMPIGSYFCAFESSLETLKDVADECGVEIDSEKTTYLEIAQLASDLYSSMHDKPYAVEIMRLLVIPISDCSDSDKYEHTKKSFENPTRNLEERIKSAIYYTPCSPPLFNFSVKKYLHGIYSYTRNEEYMEYFESKYNKPIGGRTLSVANWVTFADNTIQTHNREYKSEAVNDLLYMLVKPFIEYSEISSKKGVN